MQRLAAGFAKPREPHFSCCQDHQAVQAGAATQDAITRAAMDAVEVLKKRLRKRFGFTD
jgi:hypothetical protein